MNKKLIIILIIFFTASCTFKENLILKAPNLSFTKDDPLLENTIEQIPMEYEYCASFDTTGIPLEKLKKNDPNIIGFSNLKIEYYPSIDLFREINCIKVSGYPIKKKGTK